MIVTTRYRGRPIEVVFAWTQKEPDLVWVENIVAP